MRRVLVSMCAATFLTAVPAAASDPVLDWMKVANDAVLNIVLIGQAAT